MLDTMGFRQALSSWGLPAPSSNRGYDPAQLIEQFIVSIWCGACRFTHAETVRMDGWDVDPFVQLAETGRA